MGAVQKSTYEPSLRRSLFLFLSAILFLGALFVTIMMSKSVSAYEEDVRSISAERGGAALSLVVSRAIEREWDSINAVVGSIDPASRDNLVRFMDAVPRAGDGHVAWSAFLDTSGTVRVGSERHGEGESRAEERWFIETLRSGKVVATSTTAERAHIDGNDLFFAVQVTDADGQPVGVLVYQVRIAWISDYLTRAGEELGIDYLVVDREGSAVARSDGNLPAMDAVWQASLNIRTSGVSKTSEGDPVVYATLPNFVVGDLPDLGWSALISAEAGSLAAIGGELRWDLVWTMVIAIIGILMFALFYASHFLSPIERLVGAATALVNGRIVYPDEKANSREGIHLSQALVKLQTRH